MRKADIENIVLWRTQGIGYAEIAKRLNISRDTVKSFCMRNKITVINQSDKCKFCGNPLVQKEKVKKKRFCSDKCRLDWWHKNPDKLCRKATYSFVCARCGKPFTAYGNNHRKYCSHQCYIKERFGGKNDYTKGI